MQHHYNLGLSFYEIARAHSDDVALNYPNRVVTYTQLSDMIARLSHMLLNRGLSKGDVIVIGHDKSTLSYALMLASLRLGIAYINIDVASPTQRNCHIMAISDASVLFYDNRDYQEVMETLAKQSLCDLVFLEENKFEKPTKEDLKKQQACCRHVDGATIAYIMFTSGSTGVPKGVAVTHDNILHFIEWGKSCFDVTAKDNFANLSPMYFDNSVFDFYVGLFSGASLSPIPREILTSPYELSAYVADRECSIWFSVPSLLIYLIAMKAMSPKNLKTLRSISFGGEGYPKEELKKLYDLFSPTAKIVNVYGPTECTCICSAYDIGPDDFLDMTGFPTLGYLNQNFDYRILDDNEQQSDFGELCLIGPNVAAGYFNQPEQTNSAFVTLYEPSAFMKRMYRTGDIVRRSSSGKLNFVARKDNQIKHMGYRIELEEIETAFVKISDLVQAAVLYHRNNAAYGKIHAFVAYNGPLNEGDLQTELSKLLPSYMIPSKIFILCELPKNPNGKVDKGALREKYLCLS